MMWFKLLCWLFAIAIGLVILGIIALCFVMAEGEGYPEEEQYHGD
jgi:hypothetical protein